jgi:5'-methylthioadenosine phosphorylase
MSHPIPKADFAILSGSAGWGVKFPDDLNEQGIEILDRGLTFDSPWGETNNWQLLEIAADRTHDGKVRRVLNIFSHGWPLDSIDHSVHRKVFWALAEAGVKKVLADSTAGSLNRALRPGDFFIPNDILDLSQTIHSGLPGRFTYVCKGTQLFCPCMGKTLESVASRLWPASHRVYGQGSELIVGHAWGPRFESPAEARALRQLGCDVANQSIAAEATCAREIGACFVSASYLTNFVDGILPQTGVGDSIHSELGAIAARISLLTIAAIDLNAECKCSSYRARRPAKYATTSSVGEKR